MAKRRGRRSRSVIHSRPIQRDLSTIANRSRLLDDIQYSQNPVLFAPPVTQDRRLYHPLGPFKPARTRGGRAASVSASKKLDHRAKSRSFKNLSSVINFRIPRDVMICVRRTSRKQVLHAYKLTGRSGVGLYRRRRRNYYSAVSCRR